MKSKLVLLLAGLLCLGITGCDDDGDDSPETTTTVTTNAATGAVQTNVVAVEDVAADEAVAPADEPVEALGAPAVAPTVTGKWLGGYSGSGVNALLSLKLTQNGETVSGQYAFSDAGSGEILWGTLIDNNLVLMVQRNGTSCRLDGQVDFDAKTYTGTWEVKLGPSGTFSLR